MCRLHKLLFLCWNLSANIWIRVVTNVRRLKLINLIEKCTFTRLGGSEQGGGERGAGDREKRGRDVYGRREKRGREVGFPRWREAGEKGKNYPTLRNISQSKKCKGGGEPKNTEREPGSKGTGSGRLKPPFPPPPPTEQLTK